MFLNIVWVVHIFLKDGIDDILLEQSAHMLSGCKESVVCNGNKWPVYGFVCIHTESPCSRDLVLPEIYLDCEKKIVMEGSPRRENCHLTTFNFQCFSIISHTTTPQNLHNFVLFLLLFVYLFVFSIQVVFCSSGCRRCVV